jgi:tetratricopeptide (TPR) repeat protein
MSMDARADMFVEAAQWLRLSGDHEGAQRLLTRALELDPRNERAREHLAEAARVRANAMAPASVPDLPAAPRFPAPGLNLGAPILPRSAWELDGGPGMEMPDGRGRPGDALDVLCGGDVPPRPRTDAPRQASVPQHPLEPVPPSEAAPRGELDVLLEGATELLDLDDCSGALELLRKAGELAPQDSRVGALVARGERTLMAMLESKLGSSRSVPRLKLKPDEIIWLNLDHRAGFVLAQIDGQVSYEDLYALSGMSRLDTARIFAQLLDEGVIAADAPPAEG